MGNSFGNSGLGSLELLDFKESLAGLLLLSETDNFCDCLAVHDDRTARASPALAAWIKMGARFPLLENLGFLLLTLRVCPFLGYIFGQMIFQVVGDEFSTVAVVHA